jgi:PAS domain S-box-containing protein
MNPYPITLNEKDTFRKAVEVFAGNKLNGIPILNDEGLMTGIVSFARAFRLLGSVIDQNTPLERIMIKNPIVIKPDEDVEELIARPVSALPVVKDGRLVGMYSMTDTIQAYYNSTKNLQLELDAIIKGLYNGIITIDASESIRVINPAAAALLDVNADDVIGRNIKDVFPQAGLSEVMRSEKPAINRKIQYGDKTFLVTCTKVGGDHEIGIVIMNDFTKLPIIYEELSHTREIMQELASIIETSSDGILVTDESGNIIRVNTALTDIFGDEMSAIIGKNIREYKNIFGEDIIDKLSALGVKKKAKGLSLHPKLGERLLMVTANPIISKDSKFRGFVIDIQDTTQVHELEQQINNLEILYQQEIKKSAATEKYIFTDPKSKRVLERILQVAKVDATVLITGESGVGKEVVADLICSSGIRKDKPFVKINCGAIPESLIESELFGYEPGAFTDAGKKGKRGILEVANHGTVFLDEISALPLPLQVKLLRVLQEQEIMRVGGVTPSKIDVRVITATNMDLAEMVEKKEFRLDLYYRLNVIPLFVPPLRERKEDIPMLLHYFLRKYNEKYKLSKSFGAAATKQMLDYSWPGNVRDLENTVERLVVTSDSDVITRLSDGVLPETITRPESEEIQFRQNYKAIVDDYEAVLLKRAREQYRTTREMADALGLNQSTIVKKMARLGISR